MWIIECVLADTEGSVNGKKEKNWKNKEYKVGKLQYWVVWLDLERD